MSELAKPFLSDVDPGDDSDHLDHRRFDLLFGMTPLQRSEWTQKCLNATRYDGRVFDIEVP